MRGEEIWKFLETLRVFSPVPVATMMLCGDAATSLPDPLERVVKRANSKKCG
jgi:hypothetical protein